VKNTQTIEEYVTKQIKRGKKKLKVIRELYEKVSEGKIRIEDPSPPTTFLQYLKRLDYTLWFWTTLLLIILALLSIAVTDLLPALLPMRYVLGTIYVLFIPGYVLIEALYPEEKSLSPLERLALSIGLSLAIIPLIGLILNYTPWGIRLAPIVASTTVYSIALLITAAYRKYTLIQLAWEKARAQSRRTSRV